MPKRLCNTIWGLLVCEFLVENQFALQYIFYKGSYFYFRIDFIIFTNTSKAITTSSKTLNYGSKKEKGRS